MTIGRQVVAGQGPFFFAHWVSVSDKLTQRFAARFFRISLGRLFRFLGASPSHSLPPMAPHRPQYPRDGRRAITHLRLLAVSNALVRFFEHRRVLPFDDNRLPGPVSRSTPKSCEARCAATSEAGLTATLRGRVHKRHRSPRSHHRDRATTSGPGPPLHRDRRGRARDTFITHQTAPTGPPRTAACGRPQVVLAGGAGGLDVVRKFLTHGRRTVGERSGPDAVSRARQSRRMSA
jgi:hypothetical protein